jgi:hypothetical protein
MLIEIVSKSSLYSIAITLLLIIVFMVYFYVKKPNYVKEKKENGDVEFSLRISLLYSLLYASLIGVIFVALSGVIMFYINRDKIQLESDKK